MSAIRSDIKVERRRGPDAITKSIRWVAVAGWLLMVVALVFIDLAKPEFVTVIDRHKGLGEGKRTTWNMTLAHIIFYLQMAGFCFGVYGFFANLRRSRRKSDRYRINLIALTAISLFGMIYYLIFFT